MVRCRLQPSEGATRRTFRSAHIGVCDIREAAARERAASAAGNRPLFYFRFGEQRCFAPGQEPSAGRWLCTSAIPCTSVGCGAGRVQETAPQRAPATLFNHRTCVMVLELGPFAVFPVNIEYTLCLQFCFSVGASCTTHLKKEL